MALLKVIDDIMHYIDRHISCSEVYDDLMQSPRSACGDSHSHLQKHTEWGYSKSNGPSCWSNIAPTWNPGTGKHQSPIDLNSYNKPDTANLLHRNEQKGAEDDDEPEWDLDIKYSALQPVLTTMVNDGHTIKINVHVQQQKQCVIRLYDKQYTLKQAHFHTPSEHTEDGDHYPMELHLVHQNEHDQSIAVIGFFFDTNKHLNNFDTLKQEMDDSKQELLLQHDDSDCNEFLAQFWDYLPQKGAKKTDEDTLPTVVVEQEISFLPLFRNCLRDKNEQKLLNQTQHSALHLDLFYYQGSLTTPPCSEGVQWMVIKQPQLMSLEQLIHFHQKLNYLHNARPTQKANGRIVHLMSRVQLDMHK